MTSGVALLKLLPYMSKTLQIFVCIVGVDGYHDSVLHIVALLEPRQAQPGCILVAEYEKAVILSLIKLLAQLSSGVAGKNDALHICIVVKCCQIVLGKGQNAVVIENLALTHESFEGLSEQTVGQFKRMQLRI